MRALNRLLSLLLAMALISGGLLVAAEAAAALVGQPPLLVPAAQWAADLRGRSFANQDMQLVLSGVAVVGLMLFVAEVWPWPKRLVALGQDEHGFWWLHRRSAEKQVRRIINRATIATKTRVRLQPRQAAWNLQIDATAASEARGDIEQRARALLAQLGGPQTTSVTVRIHPRRDGKRVTDGPP
jgi:hypothetical protein